MGTRMRRGCSELSNRVLPAQTGFRKHASLQSFRWRYLSFPCPTLNQTVKEPMQIKVAVLEMMLCSKRLATDKGEGS